jgi:acylphosphatase
MADQLSAKRFYVSGYVQGVGYRFFARRAAGKLGVRGFVKNLRDGRVEVYNAELLNEFSDGFSIEYED